MTTGRLPISRATCSCFSDILAAHSAYKKNKRFMPVDNIKGLSASVKYKSQLLQTDLCDALTCTQNCGKIFLSLEFGTKFKKESTLIFRDIQISLNYSTK